MGLTTIPDLVIHTGEFAPRYGWSRAPTTRRDGWQFIQKLVINKSS